MIVSESKVVIKKKEKRKKIIFGIKDANIIETSRAHTINIGSLTGFLVHFDANVTRIYDPTECC